MATQPDVIVNEENLWRLESPRTEGWQRDVRRGPAFDFDRSGHPAYPGLTRSHLDPFLLTSQFEVVIG